MRRSTGTPREVHKLPLTGRAGCALVMQSACRDQPVPGPAGAGLDGPGSQRGSATCMSWADPHAAPAGPRHTDEGLAPGPADQVAGLARLAAHIADAPRRKERPMVILVTGGAGFIGSHTCVELLEHGHEVVVVDNYSNSSPAALEELQRLAGRPLIAYELDLRDHDGLSRFFDSHPVDAVIHFGPRKRCASRCGYLWNTSTSTSPGRPASCARCSSTACGGSDFPLLALSTVTSTEFRLSRMPRRTQRIRMLARS